MKNHKEPYCCLSHEVERVPGTIRQDCRKMYPAGEEQTRPAPLARAWFVL